MLVYYSLSSQFEESAKIETLFVNMYLPFSFVIALASTVIHLVSAYPDAQAKSRTNLAAGKYCVRSTIPVVVTILSV